MGNLYLLAGLKLLVQDLIEITILSDGYMATNSYNTLPLLYLQLLMASKTQRRGSKLTPVTSKQEIKEELGLEFLTVSVANRV